MRAIGRPAFASLGVHHEILTGVKIGEDCVAVERAEREVEGSINQRVFECQHLKGGKEAFVSRRRRSVRWDKDAKKKLTVIKVNMANNPVQIPVLIVRTRSFCRVERVLHTYVPMSKRLPSY